MQSPLISWKTPAQTARSLARRAKALRLDRDWSQKTLAKRAGVTLASYRRFETTGRAALELLLRVAYALDRLDEFDRLLEPLPARSIDELEKGATAPTRKRGRR